MGSKSVNETHGPIDERFWRFHQHHPEVYEELVTLCRKWRRRNRQPWSIKGAFEVLRYEWRVDGLPDEHEAFKLNNNYTSRYARLLMEMNPDLEGLFELRELHTTRAA